MAWIGLADHADNRFSKSGLGCDAGRAPTARVGDDALLVQGSILIETQLASDGRPLQLVSYNGGPPWNCSLSVQSIPDGGVVMVMGLGGDLLHAVARLEGVGAGETLRITYSWNAPARWARLALERVGTGHISISDMAAPRPVPLCELRKMMADPLQRRMDRHVKFMAVSTGIEPIGPCPAMTAHVPVATPWGPREVSQLKRGESSPRPMAKVCPCCTPCAASCPRAARSGRSACARPISGCAAISLWPPISALSSAGPR